MSPFSYYKAYFGNWLIFTGQSDLSFWLLLRLLPLLLSPLVISLANSVCPSLGEF